MFYQYYITQKSAHITVYGLGCTTSSSTVNTTSNQRTISDNRATKIFGTREGHVPDTPSNRATIGRVVNTEQAYLGMDQFNNKWYAQTEADGRQVWVQVRDDKIWNAGINNKPRAFHPKTGLAAPEKPSNK